VTQSEADNIGVALAKSVYCDQIFRQTSMQLTVPWHHYKDYAVHTGAVYRMTLPAASVGSDEDSVFYGALSVVTLIIGIDAKQAQCLLGFTHVRSEKMNEDAGLDEHPLYGSVTGL
jgi:hypothetical protein